MNPIKMTRSGWIALLASLTFLLLASLTYAQAELFAINWWTVDNGAGSSQSGLYEIADSIGQSDATNFASSDNDRFAVRDGFWQSDPANCVGVETVTIAGPNTTQVGETETYSAQLAPAQASIPYSYQWSPEPETGQGTSEATYTFATIGSQTVSVEVSNCDGFDDASAALAVQVDGRVISGRVLDANGQPLSGVTVSAGARSAVSGSDGRYEITGLMPDSYVVTAAQTGLTFTPASQTVTVPPDLSTIDFVALADVWITELEVTQGIQDLNNSVPLVNRKATVVRGYIQATPYQIDEVEALLYAERGGQPITAAPLTPLNFQGTTAALLDGGDRANLNDSLYFLIPNSWTADDVVLRLELDPANKIAELNENNNVYEELIAFERKRNVCVEFYGINADPAIATIYDFHFQESLEWLEAVFPFSNVLVYDNGPLSKESGKQYVLSRDMDQIFDELEKIEAMSKPRPLCADTFYYAFSHADVVCQDPCDAIGATFLWARYGWVMLNESISNLNQPLGGYVFAHEMGHGYGRQHVDCGSPDNVDPNYPYPTNQIGNIDPRGYYGYNTANHRVYAPDGATDLMTYCLPAWISDYTYRAILDQVPDDNSNFPRGTVSQSAFYTIVRGQYDMATDGIIVSEVSTLPGTLLAEESLLRYETFKEYYDLSSYTVELFDDSGNFIADEAIFFQVGSDHHEHEETPRFLAIIPSDIDVSEVIIANDGDIVYEQTRSANAPELTLSEPLTTTNAINELYIAWDADDADDDPLNFDVLFSQGADNWQLIATGLMELELLLEDLSFLAGGSESRVRVVANDGFRTAVVTSDPFTIATGAPVVQINTPEDGAVYRPGEFVHFKAFAYDREDGQLTDESLRWTVNGLFYDTGDDLVLTDLPVGEYTVTLRATDSEDKSTEQTQTFVVAETNTIYLPLVLRP